VRSGRACPDARRRRCRGARPGLQRKTRHSLPEDGRAHQAARFPRLRGTRCARRARPGARTRIARSRAAVRRAARLRDPPAGAARLARGGRARRRHAPRGGRGVSRRRRGAPGGRAACVSFCPGGCRPRLARCHTSSRTISPGRSFCSSS
jgi:hypothetical protein